MSKQRGFVSDREIGKKSTPKLSRAKKEVGCDSCELAGSVRVSGDGDIEKAEIFLVGEAPSKSDVAEGVVFVENDPDGSLLRRFVKGCGLKKVYYTTVLECQVSYGTEPSSKLIKCCKAKLEHKLEQAKSLKLIVALGTTASQWFTGGGDVVKNRGFFYDTKWGKVMVAVHPSYVRKMKGVRDALGYDILNFYEADFLRAQEYVETKRTYPDNSKLFKTVLTLKDIQDMEKGIEGAKDVGWDIEASNFEFFDQKWELYSVAVSKDNKKAWCVPFKFIEDQKIQMAAMAALLRVWKKYNLVMHNASFDMGAMVYHYNFPLKDVDDTLLAYFLIDGSRSKGGKKLKRLMLDYTEWGDYGVDYETIDQLSVEQLTDYNCTDAVGTVDLKRQFFGKMDELMLYGFNAVYRSCNTLLIEATHNGMKIDLPYAIKLEKDLAKKIDTIEEKARKITGKKDFKLGSPKQIMNYLQSQNVNVANVQAETMELIQKEHPIAGLRLDFAVVKKLNSTYVLPFIQRHAKEGDIVHGKFGLGVASTGRVASSDPNMQNIPTRIGPVIETMFVSRFKDGYIIKSDYAQMELKVAAMYSGDKEMSRIFMNDEDIHTMVTIDIYKIPLEEIKQGTARAKEGRRRAKGFNFGVIYGRGAFSIAMELGITIEEAIELQTQYFNKFYGLKQWLNDTQEQALIDGYVRNMFGNIRYIPELLSDDPRIREAGKREAVNTPIQGAASHIGLLGGKKIRDTMKKEKMKTVFSNWIHDAHFFDSPSDERDDAIAIISEMGIQVELPIETKIPLKLEVSYGRNWGEC